MTEQELILSISHSLGLDIKKRTRRREYFYARVIAFKILRDQEYKLEYIGNIFNITHSSVINGLNQFDFMLQHYPDFQEMYNHVNYKELC